MSNATGVSITITVPHGVTPEAAAAQAGALMDWMEIRTSVAATLEAAPTLLPPATLRALHDREEALRDIGTRYGYLLSGEIAAMRGSRSRNPSEYASALRRHGKVVGLTRGHRAEFPAFQFRSDGHRSRNWQTYPWLPRRRMVRRIDHIVVHRTQWIPRWC